VPQMWRCRGILIQTRFDSKNYRGFARGSKPFLVAIDL
jgi:hypothetical protein